MENDPKHWQVVTCAPIMFGEKQPERPYIKHHDIEHLQFHLVSTYKELNPPTCLCGSKIPSDIIRQFNFRASQYKGIEPLPVPGKKGLIV
jgi:hypothetical protein